MTRRFRTYLLGLSLLLTGSAAEAAQTNWYSRGFYTPVNGRVGYHMVSILTWYTDDVPPACRGGRHEPTRVSAEGTLPPGLAGASADALWGGPINIEGTPRQPGDWRVTVVITGLSCGAISIGERRVNVLFHIDP